MGSAQKDSILNVEFFRGFPEFDCREKIWRGIFHANTSADTLRKALLLPESKKSLSKSVLSRMMSGATGWGMEWPAGFLALSSNADAYNAQWMPRFLGKDKLPSEACAQALRDFVECYPKFDWTNASFLKPAADETRAYLAEINRYLSEHAPEERGEWLAAGLYSLICLFLQNAKDYQKHHSPKCCRPPKEWDPALSQAAKSKLPATAERILDVGSIQADTVLPKNMDFASPEIPALPFDFFAYVQQKFEKAGNTGEEPWIADATIHLNELETTMITPAEIHRKVVQVSKTIVAPQELYDPAKVGVLLIEDRLISRNTLLLKLRAAPYTDYGIFGREFLLESTQLDDDVGIKFLFLSPEGSYVSASPLMHLTDSQCYYLDNGDLLSARDILYLDIDETGALRDPQTEWALTNYGVLKPPATPGKLRKVTAELKTEYAQYFLMDTETMTEVPKHQAYNPQTGAAELSIIIPCPCKLAVIKMPRRRLSAEQYELLVLSGYTHGLFGLEQDEFRSAALCVEIEKEDPPQRLFQTCAGLKRRCSCRPYVEEGLRIAANANIPGAKFELAELLMAQRTPEATEEARQLIAWLWDRGYRTYGPTKSIDLLGEHKSDENSCNR